MYNVWDDALAKIQQKMNPSLFGTWFKDTSIISNENGIITIGVKNTFFIKQLKNKYYDIISDALKKSNVDFKQIEFEVKTTNKSKVQPREVTGETIASTLKGTEAIIETIKKNYSSQGNGLNAKFTLDNFVVGSYNDLAVGVAKNIIKNPGKSINPFFLYGGPGLGKTHLIQAIGNEILRQNPSFKVKYVPINHFYSDLIDSIKKNRGKDFYDKYAKLDCLIIDDFQLIVNKNASQEEFFNIFNDLFLAGKQIIVTSDRLPSQIKSVDERLASRLTWGGAYDIQLPSFEDKCAILRAKADFSGAEIEDEAIEYIAENVKTNIRDLESEFSKLLVISEIRGLSPLELINSGSTTINHPGKPKQTTSKQIIEKVAKEFNITSKDLCGQSRVSNIKTARQVVMYLLRHELSCSYPVIGKEVGGKDHSTVMHGIEKIEKDIKLDFNLREQIESIKEKIYG